MQSIGQQPSTTEIREIGALNNILSCLNNGNPSSSGEHELLISTSISPGSLGWLFDYIVFESMVNPDLDGEILQAGNVQVGNATIYSMLTFGPGWTHNETGSYSNIPQSRATMKFNGKSLFRLIL